VFCRNVLIYFDLPTKSGILGRIASVMAPDGVLYLGGAETVLRVSDRFQPGRPQQGLYELATPHARQCPVRMAAGWRGTARFRGRFSGPAQGARRRCRRPWIAVPAEPRSGR